MNALLTVSIRQKAVFIPQAAIHAYSKPVYENTALLAANLAKLGYGLSERLWHALNQTSAAFQDSILQTLREATGVNKNWTPLVKGWDVPTGESRIDHVITFFSNIFKSPAAGTRLPCGHTIPQGTFPLERYNGCPFCGTPFQFGQIERYKQGSDMKILDLWTEADAAQFLEDLLLSNTALDATQADSLKLLLQELPMPQVEIKMKETVMLVIDVFVSFGIPHMAQNYLKSPVDIMRYLWYKKTGFLQIIEPKTIIKRQAKNNSYIHPVLDRSAAAQYISKASLKLKYSRKQGIVVAQWLNAMPLDAEKMCEIMHPKREMWVRFIRALRLAEYAQRKGFDKLKQLLDLFYKEEYDVWQGRMEGYRLRKDVDKTFTLLQQRPGMFARSLFANMLWFGKDATVAAFGEVVDKVPARLVFTLYMYAENYFDPAGLRAVKPLGGVAKSVPKNKLLRLHTPEELRAMKDAVSDLCMLAVQKRFAAQPATARSMYIDPALYRMPVAIGDRSETVQDLPGALMGTRFPVEGNVVRLFMQWGQGLPAQHLDMDLSCRIIYDKRAEICSYSQLTTTGCKHSGDIQHIPNQIGTAEYIEVNIAALAKAGARYVAFTCNAYTHGSIAPNVVVGWMNSRHPMHISNQSGVAYDPSCVQHQVRVGKGLSKGMVFGLLEVASAEIIWLEMPFEGQVVQNLDFNNVGDLLKKLESKLSVGALLEIKAKAQNLPLTQAAYADEVYTVEWARNTAAVTKLLID